MEKYKAIMKTMAAEEYHLMPEVGSSTVKKYSVAPYAVENKISQTDAMKLGSAFHMFILEPELFGNHYVVDDLDLRRTADKSKSAQYAAQGITNLKVSQMDSIKKMKDAVYSKSAYAKTLLSNGVAESVVTFEIDGILCKCRPDYLTKIDDTYFCVDLKKIAPKGGVITKKEIECYIANYGCHVQAAFYTCGLKQVLETEKVIFVNIFVQEPSDGVESSCVCSMLPQSALEAGDIEVKLGIDNIKKYRGKLPTAEKFISEQQVFSGDIKSGMPSIGLPLWYKG
jgi:hypothetical protein